MSTQRLEHPQTVTMQAQMRGTGKAAQCVVKTLPDGRIRASIREAGANVVRVRVGETEAVMSWLAHHVVRAGE